MTDKFGLARCIVQTWQRTILEVTWPEIWYGRVAIIHSTKLGRGATLDPGLIAWTASRGAASPWTPAQEVGI